MTYAERFAEENPVGVLPLTQSGGLAIMEIDPCGEWAIVAWHNGENYSGFYRHKLSYDDKKRRFLFLQGAQEVVFK